MAEVKFGYSQIKNPTPSSLIFWVRVVSVIAGVLVGFMPNDTIKNLISSESQEAIKTLLGLLIAIINGLSPLFGIEVNAAAVPVKSVTAMDSGTKEPA